MINSDDKITTGAAPESAPADSVRRLVRRLRNHIAMMSPHQKEREAGKLLIAATDEINRLHAAIVMTLDENKHLADGDNCTLIRIKRAVSPNSKLAAKPAACLDSYFDTRLHGMGCPG